MFGKDTEIVICPFCFGAGKMELVFRDGDKETISVIECSHCHGLGSWRRPKRNNTVVSWTWRPYRDTSATRE
jgi:DnaJ-class molecular chaperone